MHAFPPPPSAHHCTTNRGTYRKNAPWLFFAYLAIASHTTADPPPHTTAASIPPHTPDVREVAKTAKQVKARRAQRRPRRLRVNLRPSHQETHAKKGGKKVHREVPCGRDEGRVKSRWGAQIAAQQGR